MFTETHTLKTELTAIFGLGKSFASRETSSIKAGVEVQKKGKDGEFFFFLAKEWGKWTTYCVQTEQELDAAISGSNELHERKEVAEARAALEKLTAAELNYLLATLGR